MERMGSYKSRPPVKQNLPTTPPSSFIDLTSVPPATYFPLGDAHKWFDARAAAAIFSASSAHLPSLPVNSVDYGVAILDKVVECYRGAFQGGWR